MGVEKRLALTTASALLAIIASITAAILVLCDGRLIYSLDDPYISLALGQHIAHGHYGINAGEAASPSSSILYPFLLAIFGRLSWQDWTPLIINTIAAGATGALFAREACRLCIVTRREQIRFAAALIVVLCLAINVVGLVFVGLEHSLHLLTSVFVVFALARALETGRVTRDLVFAIILLPLWRFEGLALAGLAIAALVLAGHWRPACAAALAITAALAAYAAAMVHLGLPLLPSSVLVKSGAARQTAEGAARLAALWPIVRANLAGAIVNPEAWPVFLLLGLILARPLRHPGRDARQWLLPGVVAGALVAQILFGAWGWFARYEAYAVAIGAAGAIVLWRDAIDRLLVLRRAVPVAATIVALLIGGSYYLLAEGMTPVASLGIYEQHYQMHRFATDFYRRPVGVNDLGWVSYRNPHYVLDLWGLGSEEARTLRANAAAEPAWLGRLVAEHGVGLVMIYDQWFPGQIPRSWRKLATLAATYRMTAAFDTVSVYVTGDDEAPAALTALHAFAAQLPSGTRLTILDPANLVAGAPR